MFEQNLKSFEHNNNKKKLFSSCRKIKNSQDRKEEDFEENSKVIIEFCLKNFFSCFIFFNLLK